MTRRFHVALDQGGSFLDCIAAPLHDADQVARIAKRPAQAAMISRPGCWPSWLPKA